MIIDKNRHVYRAALIGCGSMGSYVMDEVVGQTGRVILPLGHAEVLKTHPATKLVAGADPHRGRLEDFSRRWEVPPIYQDHREMLEREHPEIVSIASPPPLHREHVVDCVERGVKGILCEKPLAVTLREADQMIRTCHERGARLSVNHIRRADPYAHQARRLLEEDAIGNLLTLIMTWAGRLFLSGTHSYDLANYLVGDIPTAWLIGHAEEPTSQMTVVPTQRGLDVGGTAYAVYQNGVRVFFNGRDGNAHFNTLICGTLGMISLTGDDAQLWKREKSGAFPELLKHPFPQTMHYTAPMVFLLEDLIEAMETGRDPMSSGRTARHALEQILATHFSSQHDQCKVQFPIKDLDLKAPFEWSDKEGKVINRARSPKALD